MLNKEDVHVVSVFQLVEAVNDWASSMNKRRQIY